MNPPQFQMIFLFFSGPSQSENNDNRSSRCGSAVMNPTSIWRCQSCGVGRRCSSDPKLLWLWCRPAAVVLIGPPSLETSICQGCGPKRKKKKVIIICHNVGNKQWQKSDDDNYHSLSVHPTLSGNRYVAYLIYTGVHVKRQNAYLDLTFCLTPNPDL